MGWPTSTSTRPNHVPIDGIDSIGSIEGFDVVDGVDAIDVFDSVFSIDNIDSIDSIDSVDGEAAGASVGDSPAASRSMLPVPHVCAGADEGPGDACALQREKLRERGAQLVLAQINFR